MALGLGAAGKILLEIGLFSHDLVVALQTGLELRVLFVVHDVVKALGALLARQIIMAAGRGALGKVFLAVHRMVADRALDGLVGAVVELHDLLGVGAHHLQPVGRSGRGGKRGRGKGQRQQSSRDQGELHTTSPRSDCITSGRPHKGAPPENWFGLTLRFRLYRVNARKPQGRLVPFLSRLAREL